MNHPKNNSNNIIIISIAPSTTTTTTIGAPKSSEFFRGRGAVGRKDKFGEYFNGFSVSIIAEIQPGWGGREAGCS